ncbi:salicylate/benzoate carboxyl methyltransferase-like [Aegilops tauschii subsp. strangulata]|uniref:Benzoate carboxyl methyltransferase n=1 Tax=Aegilops tauschii TaxID=37682 RepID=M8C0P7_AEGTA
MTFRLDATSRRRHCPFRVANRALAGGEPSRLHHYLKGVGVGSVSSSKCKVEKKENLVTLRQSSNDTIVMTGVLPGSFYERLFTSGSLHLVFSSNSLHWLSKAPEDLTRNQIPAYDIDEHTRLERRPMGVIDKAKFDSFYLPVYEPSNKELREIIQDEGSFSITEMLANNPFVGLESTLVVPSRFASVTRAIFEPIIVLHFGEVMDEFVRTLERRWSREGSLQEEHTKSPRSMLAISLKKA